MTNTHNKYVAYDVYRANVTRAGYTDYFHPNVATDVNATRTVTVNDRQELYMEFGTLNLVEKGLPAEYTDYNHMGVEVHLHFGAQSMERFSFDSQFFKIGLCASRIAPADAITYRNLPNRRYTQFDDDYYFYDYSTSSRDVGGWWIFDDGAARDTIVVSFGMYSPLDVVRAIESGALCLKLADDPNYVNGLYCNMLAYGSYAPYVEVIYGVQLPSPYSIGPWGLNVYLNPHVDPKLFWKYGASDGILERNGKTVKYHCYVGGECEQSNSIVRIKPNGAVDATEYTIQGTLNEFEVPQSVSDAGGFEWEVGVTNEFGAFSGYSSTMSVITVDSIPSASIVSPKNTYVNASESAVFEWTHTVATGSPQNKYELQVLIDSQWQTLEEKTTALTTAVIPAEQLSSQITAWRVRTANNDGMYGEYSDPANIVLIVAPQVTGLTVTGNVLPAITWQSADQQGYEVMIDEATTGVCYGTQKSYAWEELLADGAHTVKVRVVNRYGLYSAWAQATHNVMNPGLETAPVLYAIPDGLSVRLTWQGEGYTRMRVYRDGALLATLAGGEREWLDNTATSSHAYTLRASNAEGDYSDSAPVSAWLALRDAAIAIEGVWRWVRLVYAPGAEPPQRTATLAPLCSLNYYSGRTYPAVEMSAHRSAAYSITYALHSAADAASLRDMLGHVVVHKRDGELLRGLLQSLSEQRTWWGETVTLSIVEVSEP